MKKSDVKSIVRLFFLTGCLLISACEQQIQQNSGILEGSISIGPLCPVETDPPNPACLPTADTYKAYPVYVYSQDGSVKITLISPSLDGTFTIELAPGTYLINLAKERIGIGSSNLPQTVNIHPFVKTQIIIDIDTGIR